MKRTWKEKLRQTNLDSQMSSSELINMLYVSHPINYAAYIQHPNANRHIFEYVSAWCYTESKKKINKEEKLIQEIIEIIVSNKDAPPTALSMLWHTRVTLKDPWQQTIVNHPNASVDFLLNLYLNPDTSDMESATASIIRDMLLEDAKDTIGEALRRNPEWKTFLTARIQDVTPASNSLDDVHMQWVEQLYIELFPDEKEIIKLLTIDDKPPF